MTWTVYTLRHASEGRTFYVGITQHPKQRLAQHTRDSASACWSRIRAIIASGEAPEFVVQHEFETKYAALLLEDDILRSTPGLDNLGRPKQIIHQSRALTLVVSAAEEGEGVMDRRGFIRGLVGVVASPAVVRVESLMKLPQCAALIVPARGWFLERSVIYWYSSAETAWMAMETTP